MNTVFLGNPVSDWLVALAATVVVAAGLDAVKSIVLRRLSAVVAANPGEPRAAGALAAALSRTRLAVLVLAGFALFALHLDV